MDAQLSYGELLALEWALDELLASLEAVDGPSLYGEESKALLERVRSMIESYPHGED